MAIKSSINNNELTLALNEDDFGFFMDTMKEWNFKDPESMLGYAISILYMNNERAFMTNSLGRACGMPPNPELLKDKD